MTQQTEAQISSAEVELEDDENWTSKSQLKRDSKDLQKLGKKLASYSPEQLARVPLDDRMIDAIELAHKLSNKRGALKRHFQFIGKILRSIDVEPIIAAVNRVEDTDNQSKLLFKKLEYWRDRIVAEGDDAINECCEQHDTVDRQKLRQLSRNYRNAKTDDKKTRFARQIFKELQTSIRDE
jgi:ribosome-associated protein